MQPFLPEATSPGSPPSLPPSLSQYTGCLGRSELVMVDDLRKRAEPVKGGRQAVLRQDLVFLGQAKISYNTSWALGI